MASKQSTVDFLTEQMADAGEMRSRKMFGEYAIYCAEKVVAFVCDDQLFLKPTEQAREFIGDVTNGKPYPGAKDYFLISEDFWDDKNWITQLIKITADALPQPLKKKPKH